MNRLLPRFTPLAIRIAAIVVVVVAVMGLAATYFLVDYLTRDSESNFAKRGQTLSLMLARMVSEGIAEENLDLVNRAAYILDEEDVVQVCVYTEFWHRIEIYPPEREAFHQAQLSPAIRNAAEFFAANREALFFQDQDDPNQHAFFARVLYQPFQDGPALDSGFVVIHLSNTPLHADRAEMLRTHLLVALLFCLVTIMLLVFLLHNQVVKPVKLLRREMEGFMQGGEPPAAATPVRDELDELKHQFGEMAGQIRRREEEALRFRQKLQRSNRELEQFAYIASHDLQEPLRVIASFVQLLEKRQGDKLDPKAREYMGYIVDATGRMKDLINDLLSYSRLATRSQPAVDIALDQILAKAKANLGLLIAEQEAEISSPGPLPTVRAEASQMTMLLQNLLANAIRYHRPGHPPRITITSQRRDQEWLVAVSDNGIGIEERYYERIFRIFQRLHTRDEYPGTGIGLAICQKIIERHQGRIWVESSPGEGSTFYFTLPIGTESRD